MKQLVLVVALASAACGISIDDPFPSFGAPCEVDAALCGVEHVCEPRGVDDPNGRCTPILSFGACDDVDGPPTHPPGRLGEEETRGETEIASVQQMDLIRDVRKATGLVRVFAPGIEDANVDNLCPMRTLQFVGNGLAIGDSNVTTLDGLQSLTTVLNGFAVFNNRDLTSIAALENLVHVTPKTLENFEAFDVVIAGNPELPQADVDAFVERLRNQTSEDLRVVACSNGGPACEGADADLLQFLAVNGLRP
jgi:hypothetical protein